MSREAENALLLLVGVATAMITCRKLAAVRAPKKILRRVRVRVS